MASELYQLTSHSGDQCVSKVEFDRVAAQTAAVESELNTWQNATLHILKRFLLENPGMLRAICAKFTLTVHDCCRLATLPSYSFAAGDCSE